MAPIDLNKLDNFISFALGLRFCVSGLQDFILDTMETTHQTILQRIPKGFCNKNCSRKYGNFLSQWCNICRQWKDELGKLCRYKKQRDRINWKEIDTIDFPYSTPDSYEAISKVFVRDVHQLGQGIYQDLGAVISLFMNMKTFSIDNQIMADVQRHRNNSFAHNYLVSVDETEKKLCLQSLIRMLKVPDIFCKESAKVAVILIEELLSTKGIPTSLLQHQAARETLALVRENFEQLAHCTELQTVAFASARNAFKERIDNLILGSTIKQQRLPKGQTVRFILKCICILIPLFGMFYILSNFPMQLDPSNEGCFSMRFLEHWKSDLDFDIYVENLNNESSIERYWLKDIVHEQLLEANGILLTANMGYGKSSIISNIVCANSSSAWYVLRKQILAYHFCRYDMAMSVSAGTFIRNLASAIVKRVPEMGNAILADVVASDFFYGTKCNKDPISCFEMSILNPLRDHWTNQKFIILIDALDECDNGDRNNLFHFLLTRIQRFPSNFKFIFTSRNIENIHKKMQFLDEKITHVFLNTSDSLNLNDVENYVRQTNQLTEPQISTLTRAANGNFLHVKLYLHYCKKTDIFDFRNVPNSLAKLYQLNFDRVFKDSENLFNDFLPVFEVLSTIQNPISIDQLLEVSQIRGNSKKRKFETLLGNELGHFLKFEDGKMSFLHKSIIDFLTDERRNKLQFFVHKENGHKLFAEYLLGKLKMNSISKHNLIELIHHVAMNKNVKYENMLSGYVKDLMKKDKKFKLELLYQVVWKYNHYHTTELVLKYMGVAAINTPNAMNQSPAFIAASQGNEKTLKCLFNNGANASISVDYAYSSIQSTFYVNYEKNMQFYSNVSTNHDIIKLCKYIYFCGYNVFHIAVQNGHKHVTEMLLRQFKNLVYSENDMHLNAFHLAVEHGHLDIVNILLKYDKSFADTHSLYKASEKGHRQIVKLLIDNGLKDECLPCNGTLYWLPLLSNRQQQTIKLDKIRSELSFYQYVHFKTFFYDDWRLIACETALNTAIRHGHLEIVKILLNETFSSIHCKTYDGKTPLMTAVRYNRTQIFYHLYLNGANLTTKCAHAFNITSLSSKLDILESTLLTTEQCPAGATVAHFIAMYGNFEMMIFMYKNGFVDWEQRDADEATPLHFAFCNYNYIFIAFNYMKNLNLNFSASTVNGSTIYHSAATCRSSILYLFYRHDRYQFNIPDCLDYNNRSILQYSMLLPLRQTHDELYTGKGESVLVFTMFEVCLNSKHNFLHIDNEGKNFLHYAAKNGNHFGFFNAFRSLSDHDLISLLTQKDTSENTPVDEIFQTMEKRSFFDPILIPSGCEIKDVFYTKCQTKFEYILTNHEMCLLKTLWYLHQKDGFAKFNATKLLSIAIRKSRIYPILMLKVYAEEQFQQIVQNNPPLLHFITEYDGPDIAEFFLTRDNSLKCNGSFSPLHEIVMNERNTHSMHYNHKFLTQYLKDYSCKILDKCFDKDGYNLLHRAVMGGNLLGTQFLVKKGMNVIHVSRHEKSALEISIIKAPFLENGAVPLRYSKSFPFQVLQYISENRTDKTIIDFDITLQYDQTAIFLLENVYTSRPSRRQKIAKLLCKPNKSHLSLVHLAAAKGFIGFLKKCTLLFGADILNCCDFNKITPFYLAKIYQQESVIKWMTSIRVPGTKPKLEVESLLMYNRFFNYNRHYLFDWTCRLHYSYKHYGLIQTQKCRHGGKDQDNFIIYKNFYRNAYIQGFQLILNFMTNFKIEPVIGFCIYDDMIHICSAVVGMNNLIVRHLKSLQKQAYTHLRKLMKFDDHDHMFLYQSALRHLFNETERKYLKGLSFNSIVSPRFRYLQQLQQKQFLHVQWLEYFSKDLEDKHKISSNEYSKFEYNLVSWMNSNISLHGIQPQFDEKRKHYESMLEVYEKNMNEDCLQCENMRSAMIENFPEICSVMDVFLLEMDCFEEMIYTNYNNIMQMSTAEIQMNIYNFIVYVEKEAKKNPYFKAKVKFFQKNMSMLLYFMQFIPTYRKSSLCMRFIVLQAEYAEKMDL